MLHKTKSTTFLRSRNLEEANADNEGAIHHINMDFDALIEEDNADNEGAIHHINMDFDALIEEDNADNEGTIHNINMDFDAPIEEDNADNEGAIHHINMDFDALIEEDEARRREEESHHVDVDNLSFDSFTDVEDRHPISDRDIDDFHKEIMLNHDNVYIQTINRPAIGYGNTPELGEFHVRPNNEKMSELRDFHEKPNKVHHVGIFSTLIVVLTLVGIAWVSISVIRRRRRETRLEKEASQYTTDFDVEDIDVRKATTGGWHGTYKNNLRYRVGTDDTDDEDFSDDIEDSDSDSGGDDDIHDDVIYEDSARSCRTQEILFIDEDEDELGEEMLVGHRNIYFIHDDIGDEDIYYASDDDLFSPVKARSGDII